MTEDKTPKIFPHFGIDKELNDAIEQERTRLNLNITEFWTNAVNHFLTCKESEKTQSMRLIVTKYPGVCLKCGHEIEQGNWAMYGKGIGLICLDCTVEKYGDKATVAKYLKNRELDQVTNALRKEADSLAEKIEAYRVIDKREAITAQQEKINKLAEDYLTHKIGTPGEKEALEELIRHVEQGKRLYRDVDDFIKRKYLADKRWRKKLQQSTDETEDSQAT